MLFVWDGARRCFSFLDCVTPLLCPYRVRAPFCRTVTNSCNTIDLFIRESRLTTVETSSAPCTYRRFFVIPFSRQNCAMRTKHLSVLLIITTRQIVVHCIALLLLLLLSCETDDENSRVECLHLGEFNTRGGCCCKAVIGLTSCVLLASLSAFNTGQKLVRVYPSQKRESYVNNARMQFEEWAPERLKG